MSYICIRCDKRIEGEDRILEDGWAWHVACFDEWMVR